MHSPLWLYAIGFMAQLFFSARILIQWIMSERSHRIVSPGIFWKLSIAGSWLLCLYGLLRNDFAIVLGQVFTYYIYIWNLKRKGDWANAGRVLRLVLLWTPVLIFLFLVRQAPDLIRCFFNNDKIPLPLVLYGVLGQLVFILRFYYQWRYSVRRGESLLPVGFWALSLAGSLLIVSYAVIRLDPVLVLGQSFGLVAYTRNIIIGRRSAS